MPSALRKGLKCVFNYPALNTGKHRSNSGKGGSVSVQRNDPQHPRQKAVSSVIIVLTQSYQQNLQILQTQGNGCTWNKCM
jgi:hypothetical protein